jgi:hypothetical protein
MSLPRTTLEQAAFWDNHVCLACDHVFDLVRRDADGDPYCPLCFSIDILPANRILEIAAFVEGLEEDLDEA